MTNGQIKSLELKTNEYRSLLVNALPEASPDHLEESDKERAKHLADNMSDLISSIFRMLNMLDSRFDMNCAMSCVKLLLKNENPCDHQGLCLCNFIPEVQTQDIGVEAGEKIPTIAILPDNDPYSKEAIVQILMNRDRMSESEARETIKEFEEEMKGIEDYFRVEDMFTETFSLEPDYLFCFLNV